MSSNKGQISRWQIYYIENFVTTKNNKNVSHAEEKGPHVKSDKLRGGLYGSLTTSET